MNETSGPTTVASIGGSFATRATVADTYTLPAGTHQISTDGFFISNAATSGKTRLQVAVRGPAGQDFGTCFTGLASMLAQREATCSTTRVVTVSQPTQVTVFVFGYADTRARPTTVSSTLPRRARQSRSADPATGLSEKAPSAVGGALSHVQDHPPPPPLKG